VVSDGRTSGRVLEVQPKLALAQGSEYLERQLPAGCSACSYNPILLSSDRGIQGSQKSRLREFSFDLAHAHDWQITS
jgi:hypothetical protein